MNHKFDKDTPRFDVQLSFDEIGIALDDAQYRSAISLVDMYHVYLRQYQYRKYRPNQVEFKENRAKALLKYAGTAILTGVQERRRKWTWEYFAERRDDRLKYVDLFKRKLSAPLLGEVRISIHCFIRNASFVIVSGPRQDPKTGTEVVLRGPSLLPFYRSFSSTKGPSHTEEAGRRAEEKPTSSYRMECVDMGSWDRHQRE